MRRVQRIGFDFYQTLNEPSNKKRMLWSYYAPYNLYTGNMPTHLYWVTQFTRYVMVACTTLSTVSSSCTSVMRVRLRLSSWVRISRKLGMRGKSSLKACVFEIDLNPWMPEWLFHLHNYFPMHPEHLPISRYHVKRI